MTADGWLSEPNGEGWYWMGADQAIALGGRRVYPVIDVPKEIAR